MGSTIQWAEKQLRFGFTARTSRETMTEHSTYIIRKRDAASGQWLYGECNFFESLAPESRRQFLEQLQAYCRGSLPYEAVDSSALRCGIDMLELPLPQTRWIAGQTGISINGLIWMDSKENMRRAITDKLEAGFRILKLKIGGINFDDELDLIRLIRSLFSADDLELRLDANGSFQPDSALDRLEQLAPFGIHSIEQPICAGQPEQMHRLCALSPIPIALDEELIGLRTDEQKQQLLQLIRPAYIIVKPSLCGGLRQAARWIETALRLSIDWWLTSALESSLGLMRLCAFVSQYDLHLPQGLGTGQIYTNNFASTLYIDRAAIWTSTPPSVECDNLDWQ